MTTLLFVHGTGVREVAYKESLAEIEKQVASWGPVQVTGCFWGELHGARLHAGGASVPTFDASRALGGDTSPSGDPEADLWALLLIDPLAELRLLAATAPRPGDAVHFSEPPGAALMRDVDALGSTSVDDLPAPLVEALAAAHLKAVFSDASRIVAASEACQDALNGADGPLGDFREAVARAVVAQAVALDPGIDPENRLGDAERQRIIALLVALLGGGERFGLARLGKHIRDLTGAVAMSVGTFAGKRYRGRITDGAARVVGDILLYQTANLGERIRDAIATSIRTAGRAVVLVAHSLGGVASVDLLARETSLYAQIELFVTIGSQSPFYYELGVLDHLPFGQKLPSEPPFPRWLNFYDLADFLSYVGGHPQLFGAAIKDVQVFSRKSFPESHSAYIRDPDVWKTIEDELRTIRRRRQ